MKIVSLPVKSVTLKDVKQGELFRLVSCKTQLYLRCHSNSSLSDENGYCACLKMGPLFEGTHLSRNADVIIVPATLTLEE